MLLSDPRFPPEDVLTHPQHQIAQTILVQLIEQLRGCEGPADGYELQQELLERVMAADTKRNACSQAAKLMRKGRAPQPGAPELESGMDPSLTDSWIFEREIWERIGRQYRSIGDAMAWRAFGFERRFILALCRNQPPGVMAGKAGTVAELAAVKQAWRADGAFALLHDLTNCLRIGDITIFGSNGPPVTHEIKTNPNRRSTEQLRRIQAARDAVWQNAALPGNDPRERLYDLPLPFRTHLQLLREATERAAADGVAAVAVPGSRALAVIDQYGLINAGVTNETFSACFDLEYAPALRAAGIESRRDFNITAISIDSVARDPLRVPWGVYPLHPYACARLIGDVAGFIVETSGPALAQQLQAAGVPAQWVRPPSQGGELSPGEVVMEVTSLTKIPLGKYVLEDQRTLQMRRSELDRYLIELIHPATWVAGIRHLVENSQTPGRPWPHYRDEHLEWA